MVFDRCIINIVLIFWHFSALFDILAEVEPVQGREAMPDAELPTTPSETASFEITPTENESDFVLSGVRRICLAVETLAFWEIRRLS